MEQKQSFLDNIAITDTTDVEVNTEYADNDIVVIDNIKIMTEPEIARLQMNMLAFCNKGKVQLNMNGHPIILKANQLIISPSKASFSDFMFSPDFDFKVIFISNRMLHSALNDKISLWTDLIYSHQVCVLDLDPKDISFLMQLAETTLTWIRIEKKYPYQDEIKRSIMRACLLTLCGILNRYVPEKQTIIKPVMSSKAIFQKFITLLQTTSQKYQTVNAYSKQLFITPKYLTSICKTNSGKTASEWIREHVLEDIRYYLKQTDYSIKEICNFLGFPNLSFFGKYVKRNFGMPPAQFRKQ